jgi:N-acylneuraminate cytidylyltransferase
MKPQYYENGSIYVFRPWVLRQCGNRLGGKIALYVMGEEQGVDIDSEADLDLVEHLLGAKGAGGQA